MADFYFSNEPCSTFFSKGLLPSESGLLGRFPMVCDLRFLACCDQQRSGVSDGTKIETPGLSEQTIEGTMLFSD